MRFLIAFALLVLPCCGASTQIRPESSGVTRYRVGDRIVYRYAGSLLPHEVFLEERITDVSGLRLRIEVTARRIDESGVEEVRRWIQVVTDSAENQAENNVDELYTVDADGTARRLENRENADLVGLYEWTLPDLDWGDPGEERRETRTLSLAGHDFSCVVATTPLPNVASDAEVSLSDCASLVWTHGPASVTRGGEAVWTVDVVELEGGL